MKNKLSVLLCMSLAVWTMVACGSSEDDTSDVGTTENELVVTPAIEVVPIDANDYITLCDYSEVLVTSEMMEVTEEDIDEYIKWGLESLGETIEVTDRAVEHGDTVNIDFDGTIDGLPEDDTSVDGLGYDLVIGSGSFIDGFEDGLLGAQVGDTVTLNLTFPESYPNNPDIEGNDAVFEVVINAIKVLQLPELTDDIAATLEPTVATVEEYREFIREMFNEEVLVIFESSIQSEIFTYILMNSTYEELPEDMIQYYQKVYYDMVSSYVGIYGMTLEDYAVGIGMTMEAFEEESFVIAEEMAKEYITFKMVAEIEGITVTEDEIDQMAMDSMLMSGFAVETAEEYIEQVGAIQIEHTLLAEKVLPQMVQYAVYE